MMKPEEVRKIWEQHQDYWASCREELEEYSRFYLTRYWTSSPLTTVRVELPSAYKVVESYVGSLFSRQPSVVVKPDVRGRGNPDVAQAVSNLFLARTREVVEDALRLALIYPSAYIKLAPVESVDPLERVGVAAIPPWEVVVDATAPTWDAQRWVGHTYMLPKEDAAQRYGVSPDRLRGQSYRRGPGAGLATPSTGTRVPTSLADLYMGGKASTREDVEQWITVLEFYDLRADRLVVWSPDYTTDGQQGGEFLFSGVKVETGTLGEDPEPVTESAGIPYKTASGRPVVPIIPLYFARNPEEPMRGYSLVGRSRDQFREVNIIRTAQAQGVRRMARNWLSRQGSLSEEAAAKLAQNVDGEVIEVDLAPGATIADILVPVPVTPIPADILSYAGTVSADIQEAGLLAPFTRGEVSRTTATEANLLAGYSATEIGRMARARDAAIARIAQTYCSILALVLGEGAEPLALPYPSGPTMLSADDLTGDMSFFAEDAGATPIADAAKRQSLVELAPLLVQLGADPAKIRKELVRSFQLPENLAEAAEVQPAPEELPPEVP
jgi:hypothetical protein